MLPTFNETTAVRLVVLVVAELVLGAGVARVAAVGVVFAGRFTTCVGITGVGDFLVTTGFSLRPFEDFARPNTSLLLRSSGECKPKLSDDISLASVSVLPFCSRFG